ncbi:MAG: hypothetical protein M3430_08465 [Acidobacteriota bacterium]|nr:hypothetical protein [Acidobacteriota bacterium]
MHTQKTVLYDPARIDTLIALALSRRHGGGSAPRQEDENPADKTDAQGETRAGGESFGEEDDVNLLGQLSGLSESDQRAVERRWKTYVRLSPDEQTQWARRALARARAGRPERNRRFDKNIHPTHIVEALRDERMRVQLIILHTLPPSQAEPAAAALGLTVTSRRRRRPIDSAACGEGAGDLRVMRDDALSTREEPALKLAAVVRRAFFAQFVTADALVNPTALDLLSGVELVRLIRLLGVRETAVACRGISAVETVTSFLRRFPAEEAHAIAAHISAFTTVEPRRAAFAGGVARRAIGPEFDAAAMLDRIGVALLAVALEAREPLRRRYAAQKLPTDASRELLDLVARSHEYCEPELARRIVEETETLAVSLRRFPSEAAERRVGLAYEAPSRQTAEGKGTDSE